MGARNDLNNVPCIKRHSIDSCANMEQRARDKESGEDPEHEACQSRNGTDASVSTGRLSIAQMLNAEDVRREAQNGGPKEGDDRPQRSQPFACEDTLKMHSGQVFTERYRSTGCGE